MPSRKRQKAAEAGSHTETEAGESVEEEEEGVGQANYLEAPVHFQSLREVIVTPRL